MIKISITGKANSGKNTVAKLLHNIFVESLFDSKTIKHMAFADPIKEMIHIAYPNIPRKWLYGSSKFRSEVIPGAFKNGIPLTIRQCLIDIGNDFGRANKSDIWLRNFDNRFAKYLNKKVIIINDCRFRNEFDHLKSLGFYQIRLLRDSFTKINNISETNQDEIKDNEFNIIINNNYTIVHLESEIRKIVTGLTK